MSEKTSTKKQRRVKVYSSGDRLERALEKLAIVVVWDLVLFVLITYVSLMATGKADILQPFRSLVLLGFVYWFSTSFLGAYLHYTEKRFQNPISLFFKVLLGLSSIPVAIYSMPSVLFLEAWFTMNISFDNSIIVAFIVGVSAAIIGLLFLTQRASKSWEREDTDFSVKPSPS